MQCPTCEEKAHVRDIRQLNNSVVRRRYKCTACQHRWTTYESPVNAMEVKIEAFTTVVNTLVKRNMHLETELVSMSEQLGKMLTVLGAEMRKAEKEIA